MRYALTCNDAANKTRGGNCVTRIPVIMSGVFKLRNAGLGIKLRRKELSYVHNGDTSGDLRPSAANLGANGQICVKNGHVLGPKNAIIPRRGVVKNF